MDNKLDDLMTLPEVAGLLKLKLSTLREWRKKGRLPFTILKVSPKAVRIPRSSVLAWLEDLRIKSQISGSGDDE